jgi:predicted RND superfamily exporter protein
VGPAVVYDASSNVLGFAPLVLSMMVPVQHFGWLISLCMVFSALATLVVLPAALQLSGRRLLSKGDSTYMQTSSSEVLTT